VLPEPLERLIELACVTCLDRGGASGEFWTWSMIRSLRSATVAEAKGTPSNASSPPFKLRTVRAAFTITLAAVFQVLLSKQVHRGWGNDGGF